MSELANLYEDTQHSGGKPDPIGFFARSRIGRDIADLVCLRRRAALGVTAHPTAEWIARQLTEACGWECAPRYTKERLTQDGVKRIRL